MAFHKHNTINYRPTFSKGKVRFISVGLIERMLLAHNTSFIYILPEVIADIVHHPLLHHRNGTPVYHIVEEPYSNPTSYYNKYGTFN